MKTFKKWNGKAIEDTGAYMSKEAISFCTAFKNMLKREGKKYGFEPVNVTKGHYFVSGFAKSACLFALATVIAGMAVWCVMQKAKKTTRVKATTFVHLKNCLKHLIKCSQDAEANFLRNKCRNMQCTGEIRL